MCCCIAANILHALIARSLDEGGKTLQVFRHGEYQGTELFQSSGNTSPTTETLRENRKTTSYVLEGLVLTSDPTPHHLYEIPAPKSQ